MLSVCIFKYLAQISDLAYKTIMISTPGLQSQLGQVTGGGKRLEAEKPNVQASNLQPLTTSHQPPATSDQAKVDTEFYDST